jgi:hypothetical protein
MRNDEVPDPQKLVKLARKALTSSEYRKKFCFIDFWGLRQLYQPQLRIILRSRPHLIPQNQTQAEQTRGQGCSGKAPRNSS